MAQICVIVPVYQVKKYIDRCVHSILNQSYRDFKLLLIDDGSTDGSSEQCDEYASQDSRVHVIHKEHVGVSVIRNEGIRWGLEESGCPWLIFVDSDDWIHPEMLERLLNAAQGFQVKVAVSDYAETKDETSPWGDQIARAQLWEPDRFYLEHFITSTIPVAKLYHRSCFVGRVYPKGKIHEDEFITYQILFEQDKFAAILSPMYAYYYNPESITKRPWTPDRLDSWGAYEQQLVFFQEKGYPELVKFRMREYLENALVNLKAAETSPKAEEYADAIRFIKKRIRNVIRRCYHAGCIQFAYDYETLVRFYPFLTRAYRFYLEKLRK